MKLLLGSVFVVLLFVVVIRMWFGMLGTVDLALGFAMGAVLVEMLSANDDEGEEDGDGRDD
jgi:hypothetical protein